MIMMINWINDKLRKTNTTGPDSRAAGQQGSRAAGQQGSRAAGQQDKASEKAKRGPRGSQSASMIYDTMYIDIPIIHNP